MAKLAPTQRFLIVNADDLNHAEEINAGIAVGISSQIITSTSAIVNTTVLPSTCDIVDANRQVSVGLHFMISRYAPVAPISDIRSLMCNGRFMLASVEDDWGDAIESFVAREVATELSAQMDRFVSIFDRPPSHIDSHHYVHAHQPVKDVVLEYALKHAIPVRRPEAPTVKPTSAMTCCPMMTDYLITEFRRGDVRWPNLRESLLHLGVGWSELVCHVRRPRGCTGVYESQRAQELSVLCSAPCIALLHELNVSLRSYYDFRKEAAQW